MSRLLPLSVFLAGLAASALVQAADPSSSAPASLEVDQLEWQHADEGSVFNWDLEGWALGGGANRLDFRSQGERTNGHTEQAEVQALWGHALAKGWGSVAGIRQDFKPGSPQTWAALGIQEHDPEDLDVEITAFFGENNQTALRLEAEYDWALTQRLILQPHTELNFYGRNDESRGQGAGFAESEAGLRLRYQVTPEVAPYVGVSWNATHGNTAAMAREEGEDTHDARLVVGLHLEF